MILVIDNYDSFTYNLVQYLGELGESPEVRRNDRITPEEIEGMAPEAIILSPGPGKPEESGVCPELVRRFAGRIPILGVCLGHQVIARVFGGQVVRAGRLMHGKTSPILHDGQTLFRGMPSLFEAMRYHSLIVDRKSLPEDLLVSAETPEGEVMALRHRDYPLEGVQFHPESVLTQEGKKLLINFLDAHLPGRPARAV
ncbi:anthranilate synthase component II [Planifilum fimeticola]